MADYPIYKFLIGDDDEEGGMVAISLVENPAFESKFLAFNKQEKKEVKPIKFVKNEKYKQVLTGLIAIPDKLIYRYDKDIGDYYGVFTAEEIEKMRNKYHKQLMTSNFNTDHNPSNTFDGYVIESFILNTEGRVQEALDFGLVDAVRDAWQVSVKIEDEEVFNDVLEGKYTGFSLESFLELEKFSVQKNNFNVKNQKMKSKLEKIKDKILSIFTELNFEQALVPELGFEIKWGEVGAPVVKVLSQEGSEVEEPVGEGEYVTDMGIVVVDEASNLVEIKEVEEEAPAEEEVEVEATEEVELATANATYKVGEEDVTAEVSYTEVDAPVMIGEQNISEVVEIAETLEIVLESGEILIVNSEGILTEIRPVEEEEAPAEEFKNKEKFATSDMDKKLKDLIGDREGEYYISVTVDANGNYSWGSVSAYSNLVFKSEHTKEVRKLQREVKKLKEKLSEPVAEPVLTNDKQEKVDVTKLSTYERLMYERGLEPAFKSKK